MSENNSALRVEPQAAAPDQAGETPAAPLAPIAHVPDALGPDARSGDREPAASVPETLSAAPASAGIDQHSAACLPANPLLTLKQLSQEPNESYSVFIRYVMSDPIPSLENLAKEAGVVPRTLFRWKARFRWAERIRDYNLSRLAAAPPPIPEPAVPAPPDATEVARCDFKTKALSIALSAMERWQTGQDAPVTLSGIVRLLELALRLTGQNGSSGRNNIETSPGFAQLMKSMEKVYGPGAAFANPTAPLETRSMSVPEKIQTP